MPYTGEEPKLKEKEKRKILDPIFQILARIGVCNSIPKTAVLHTYIILNFTID
jgi:hypothetical protein